METADLILLAAVFGGVMGVFVAIGILLHRRSGSGKSERWSAAVKKAPEPPAPERKKGSKKSRRSRRPRPAYMMQKPLLARVATPLAALWKLGDTSQSRVQELLVHAGIREKGAVEVFLGAKFALALALPAATAAFFLWRSNATGADVDYRRLFMFGVGALCLGMMAPIMWLRGKARRRVERIRLSLPDALDLLIVCIESGLGLDAALLRISREMAEVAPEFSEELVLLNLEISAGKPREECLRNLALRSGCDEVESLTARINQASKYGTNLGTSLRIHSESLRQKRRQEAEERAAKTSVKLLFPLVFFIFPAIFVVILGPAVANLWEYFSTR